MSIVSFGNSAGRSMQSALYTDPRSVLKAGLRIFILLVSHSMSPKRAPHTGILRTISAFPLEEYTPSDGFSLGLSYRELLACKAGPIPRSF